MKVFSSTIEQTILANLSILTQRICKELYRGIKEIDDILFFFIQNVYIYIHHLDRNPAPYTMTICVARNELCYESDQLYLILLHAAAGRFFTLISSSCLQ